MVKTVSTLRKQALTYIVVGFTAGVAAGVVAAWVVHHEGEVSEGDAFSPQRGLLPQEVLDAVFLAALQFVDAREDQLAFLRLAEVIPNPRRTNSGDHLPHEAVRYGGDIAV